MRESVVLSLEPLSSGPAPDRLCLHHYTLAACESPSPLRMVVLLQIGVLGVQDRILCFNRDHGDLRENFCRHWNSGLWLALLREELGPCTT